MKIQKLEKFKEKPMVTEANQSDVDNIKHFVELIQQHGIPGFGVMVQGLQGQIIIDGEIRFTTSGANTVSVIFAYVSGVFLGLRNCKK